MLPCGEGCHPLARVWSLMVLAQHYGQIGQAARGLPLIRQALADCPTLIELYLVKGRLQKHLLDIRGAADTLEEAQRLDQADRYLNNKCIKYALRAGRVDRAEQLYESFMRESCETAVLQLQTMWYELEMGRCFWLYGQHQQALRHYNMVDKHFADIVDDQFDFHVFAFRKYAIRSFLEMVDYQDQVYKNVNFLRSVAESIPKLLYLHFHPDEGDEQKKKKKKKGKNKKPAVQTPKEKAREAADYFGAKHWLKIKDRLLDEALGLALKVMRIRHEKWGQRKIDDLYVKAICASLDILIVSHKPILAVRALSILLSHKSAKYSLLQSIAIAKAASFLRRTAA